MAHRLLSAPLRGLVWLAFGLVLPGLTVLGLWAGLAALRPPAAPAAEARAGEAGIPLALAPTPQPALSFQPAGAPVGLPPAEELPPLPDIPNAYCLPADSERAYAPVLAVPAADRITVELDGQAREVGYIGVDISGLRPEAAAAALSVNQTLVGLTVLLVSDPAAAPEARYVIAGELFVNYQLVEWGLALPQTGTGAACEGFLLAAQANAQAARAGQWAPVDVRTPPQEWRVAPVVPQISEYARAVYLAGLAGGNDPNRFSILGDCQSLSWRLFQRLDWDTYIAPPEEATLEPTRLQFQGSFSRQGVTTASGATVASMFSVYWADPEICDPNETPIACELRVYNPSLIVVSLGTNETMPPAEFETYLRRIVAFALERNVLPILATKADETTSGHPYNQVIAQVAYDNDIPLWNFWAAVQGLPNGGIKPDDPRGIHLLPEAYPIKRLTGLQALHAVLEAARSGQ
ncbi:MAG: SGNH/GDSL hydrolase family protein [Chloroflexi bacterium]|nr:SGNH/GDSL hydrolase family protein [Chloroflexota bacterium]